MYRSHLFPTHWLGLGVRRLPLGGGRCPCGRCDDGAVLRTIILIVALSLQAVACALVEQPVPPGTIPFQGEVQNDRGPVELSVTTPAGTIPGAVRPASLPA